MRAEHLQHTRLAFALLCIVCALKVFSYAWVTEDAYITFRVLDNFVHGFGLRWNIDERVQAFTSPLWLFLHAPFYFFYRDVYSLTIILSAICGVACVWLMCRTVQTTLARQAVLVILPLALSRSFNDFTICGLENPLLFALLAWFLLEWFNQARFERLWLIGSLFLLARLDGILLLAPALAWITWQHRRNLITEKWLISISPIMAWLAFSLLYYGFIFPNTKYAKLSTGISTSMYVRQGWRYISSFVYYDMVGFAVIVGALLASAYAAWKIIQRKNEGHYLEIALIGLGCLLHIGYVVRVGGDFMAGRFLSTPLIASVVVLYVAFHRLNIRPLVAYAGLITAVWLINANHPFHAAYGIGDERGYFWESNGLFTDQKHFFRPEIVHKNVHFGKKLAKVIRRQQKPYISYIRTHIGMLGYYAGPKARIIDRLGLSDPLLARLPTVNLKKWRIGHFIRHVPAGYEAARNNEDYSSMGPNMAAYYQRLRLVVMGDIWSWERLKTIAGFQLGYYPAPLVPPLVQQSE